MISTITGGLIDPYQFVFSLDGTKAYLTNGNNPSPGFIAVINTSNNTVSTTIAPGPTPTGIAITPDGTHLYVSYAEGDEVVVINTSGYGIGPTIGVGSAPEPIATTPDGKSVYVVNGEDNTVSVIDIATNSVVTTLTVGTTPSGLAITTDATTAYVLNNGSNNVTVIDVPNTSITGTLTTGSEPTAWGNFIQPTYPGFVSFVSNYDGTLNISPNAGAVVASLNPEALFSPWD